MLKSGSPNDQLLFFFRKTSNEAIFIKGNLSKSNQDSLNSIRWLLFSGWYY
jgi:hypothetical protein